MTRPLSFTASVVERTAFPSPETSPSSVNSRLFLFRKPIRVDTIPNLESREDVYVCALMMVGFASFAVVIRSDRKLRLGWKQPAAVRDG